MNIREYNVKVDGMSCAACSARLQKVLTGSKGVVSASVNLAAGTAKVIFNDQLASIDSINEAIERSGFTPSEDDDSEDDEDKRSGLKRSLPLILAAFLTLPLVINMLLMFAGVHSNLLNSHIFQLLLAAPVQFVAAAGFYRRAFSSLINRSPGMDILVVLGTGAAFFYSLYTGFTGAEGHLYYEASAMVITLVLLGKHLESRAKVKTTAALKKLIKLRPAWATLLENGAERKIRAEELKEGQVIAVKSGETIPADAVAIEGNADVSESMMTGEPFPQAKGPGKAVSAGTVCSAGYLVCRVKNAGESTVLSGIIRAVRDAGASRTGIQKTVDRVSAVFAPTVIIIAGAVFAGWMAYGIGLEAALLNAVSVLVIACPCALGLATPAAIVSGAGAAALRGIIIKNGVPIENSRRINAVVLDKTGTITEGVPEVEDVIPLEGYTAEAILSAAASAERMSEHPLAKTIVGYAAQSGAAISDAGSFRVFPGQGVSAMVNGKEVIAGTPGFLDGAGVYAEAFSPVEDRVHRSGLTAVYVAIDGNAAGIITAGDTLRSDSAEAITKLQGLGLEVFMLTGDNHASALKTASEAGIKSINVFAGLLPGQKAAKISELRQLGLRVIMAGDGINDAPALAAADTGISMAGGSDIAVDSGDIALVHGGLKGVYSSLIVSRKIMNKIRQNLFWAFFYNAAAIPFAALGFLNPYIAGAAMAFSSVSVVLNSLTLRKSLRDV